MPGKTAVRKELSSMPSVNYKACDLPSAIAKPSTPSQWAAITCFQLVYSMVNTGMGLYVLPREAQRLHQHNSSFWVGVFLTVCGATQVICPIAGKLSDRHQSRFGRRRPFIVAGTFCAVMSFALMRVASQLLWPQVYLSALFMGELALNIVYSAQCGLPVDLQEKEHGLQEEGTKGIVSGLVALHSFLGSIAAMGFMALTRSLPVQVQYPVFMSSLIIVCGLVCVSAHEMPTHHLPASGDPVSLDSIFKSFLIDLEKDKDFFWVCVGRLFYYISTSGVVFLYYYIHDMLYVKEDADVRSHLAFLVILAQLVGAAGSVPFSRLSNEVGRKLVIYYANALMATTFILYSLAPLAGERFAWPVALLAGLCFGVGSGAYLSVDYALALDCMPVGKSTAEAFGLWGIAGFAGSTVGPMLSGLLLSASRKDHLHAPFSTRDGEALEEYSYIGYVLVMLVTGSLMNGMVAAVTSRIVAAK
mmetsp:Transcript_30055/g.55483  ORF Transcript_30055/g.55483 Transcript_30055/m.55483 type:complete len:473 (-) Transcript_30055:112-1530(-)